jgi:hypothetical protein
MSRAATTTGSLAPTARKTDAATINAAWAAEGNAARMLVIGNFVPQRR